ncbi:MAG: hypothetical protein WAK24_13405 [Candidatus Acidiferrales bacterium]
MKGKTNLTSSNTRTASRALPACPVMRGILSASPFLRSGPLVPQDFSQTRSSFMKLRFGISHRASGNRRNFIMTVAFHVVQQKHGPASRGQAANRPLQIYAIDCPAQLQVPFAQLQWLLEFFFIPIVWFIKRIGCEFLPPEAH